MPPARGECVARSTLRETTSREAVPRIVFREPFASKRLAILTNYCSRGRATYDLCSRFVPFVNSRVPMDADSVGVGDHSTGAVVAARRAGRWLALWSNAPHSSRSATRMCLLLTRPIFQRDELGCLNDFRPVWNPKATVWFEPSVSFSGTFAFDGLVPVCRGTALLVGAGSRVVIWRPGSRA